MRGVYVHGHGGARSLSFLQREIAKVLFYYVITVLSRAADDRMKMNIRSVENEYISKN